MLRGELETIEQNGDNVELAALLTAIVATHPSIELGYPEMIKLVNASQYDVARLVVRRSRLNSTSFSRVRTATEPGSDLLWAALRGELQSRDLLNVQDEAAALTAEMRTARPHSVVPDDIAMPGIETTRA